MTRDETPPGQRTQQRSARPTRSASSGTTVVPSAVTDNPWDHEVASRGLSHLGRTRTLDPPPSPNQEAFSVDQHRHNHVRRERFGLNIRYSSSPQTSSRRVLAQVENHDRSLSGE